MSQFYKCPKCSGELGMSGGRYCCWNSTCDFRSYRPWIDPPRSKSGLSIDENTLNLIGCCINAAAFGPFFIDSSNAKDPYWEYQTLLGLDNREVKKIAAQWPDVDVTDGFVLEFIESCITWLLAYPHRRDDVWNDYIPISKEELNLALKDWKLKWQKCT
jgi:hypothetical protein